jgi:hypothetical protein
MKKGKVEKQRMFRGSRTDTTRQAGQKLALFSVKIVPRIIFKRVLTHHPLKQVFLNILTLGYDLKSTTVIAAVNG